MKKKQKTSKQKKAHKDRAKRLMQNITLYSWESSEILEGTRTSTAIARLMGIDRALNQKDVNLIVRQRLNWTIACRALCEVSGDTWVETEIVSANDFMINDLAEHYERMREQVLASVNTRTVCDLGWICRSFNKNNPIDTNFELKFLGRVTPERKSAWQKLHQRDLINV